KGRPGTMLSVLCPPELAEQLSAQVLRHTTATGVRLMEMERRKLRRELLQVDTAYGPIQVKRAWGAGVERLAPEYEDCRRAALEYGVAISEVFRAAEQAARTA
ncbi:MAG: DUF111 family protein, partial [Deinococcus sp.]|nr:DUF111 family protein [Deinococcus sp.]